jgi:hypothetical protein
LCRRHPLGGGGFCFLSPPFLSEKEKEQKKSIEIERRGSISDPQGRCGAWRATKYPSIDPFPTHTAIDFGPPHSGGIAKIGNCGIYKQKIPVIFAMQLHRRDNGDLLFLMQRTVRRNTQLLIDS